MFTTHAGRDRNHPITRVGNLAMIPHGVVRTNNTMGPMEVYLIELRSIGGMSGSPVLLPHRVQIGKAPRPVSLLGVLLGHYPVQPLDIGGVAVNSGIEMVAPARMIGEILDQEALMKRRKEQETRAEDMQGPAVMDTADLDEVTRERFLADLSKAAKPSLGES